MNDNKYLRILTFFVSVMGLVLILFLLKTLQQIFLPLIIAYFLVLVFQPMNKYLVEKKIPLAVTTLINLLILTSIVWGIVNIFSQSITQFSEAFPEYSDKFFFVLSKYTEYFNIKNEELEKLLSENINYSKIFKDVFSSTMSFLSSSFLVLFFFIFLNSRYDDFLGAIKEKYKKKNDKKLEKRINEIPQKIQSYIITKIFINIITTTAVGIILYFFKVDFIVIWMTLTFLFNFIPNFGSIIAIVLPTLTVFLQYNSFGKAAAFALTAIIIQNIIGNFLEPKIMGSRLGLSPTFILLSLLIWGYIWGIAGMFLAVPIMAVIKILISDSDSETVSFISKLIG